MIGRGVNIRRVAKIVVSRVPDFEGRNSYSNIKLTAKGIVHVDIDGHRTTPFSSWEGVVLFAPTAGDSSA
jgi:hypothetical protein